MKISGKIALAVIVLATAFMAPLAKAQVINFDAVDTSGGTVTGATVTSYLAGYGVSFSTSYAIYPVIEPYPVTGWMTPVSGSNSFGPQGLASAFSYTLSFANPLDALSFTRPGFSPAHMSAWSAKAYAADNTLLASVGEGMTTNAAQATFTLTGSGIDYVVFTDDAQSFAGTNFRMDDLTLTAAVPEPEIYAMMGLGLGLIGWARRRKPAA